ncbi:hypothetical protein QEN42_19405 [Gordonia alkanivorans]|uniref:DUF4760 domain-containing protein n=1 Tax=Gordonia alkanivorans TaxID=84096 RepID=UPI002449316B|nr:hypothetical protein [Gordonia alkanivorans]MDH3052005.1 hypothetical protein [Gordonia alkanivorans]
MTTFSWLDWIPAVSAAISLLAFGTAVLAWRTARHNVSTKVLIDMFNEHRSEHLASARTAVYKRLKECDPKHGIEGLPDDIRTGIRDLAWFYDNLGLLVHHGVVDIEPVSGYLGGSVQNCWKRLEPFIAAERAGRSESPDPERWQVYFELLDAEVRRTPPEKARLSVPRLRIRRLLWGQNH